VGAGGSLGAGACLRPCLPSTDCGILTGTGKDLADTCSRTGVASGLAARPAGLCLSAGDCVLAFVDP